MRETVLNKKMDFIDPLKIDLGKRMRGDYVGIEELADDMKVNGMISPIAIVLKSALDEAELKSMEPKDPRQPYLLIAGGRRTMAALSIQLKQIPALIFEHTLTAMEIRTLELHENLNRKRLSPPEELAARAEILRLMQEQYGEKISTAPDASGVSLRDVADQLGVSAATLSRDVQLHQFLQENPDLLSKVKTKADAARLREEEIKREALKEVARRQKMKSDVQPKLKKGDALIASYQLGNFFDGVGKVTDGIVNFVELDPPYAIDLHGQKKKADTSKYNEIKPTFYEDFMRKTLAECYRVMSSHSWLVCWFGPEPWFQPLADWIVEAGFEMKRIPGVWTKRTGQTHHPDKYLGNAAEFFFYARKGSPGMNKQGRINVFDYSPVHSTKKIHPTERPIEMMQDIINTFARESSTVMVPFAGSGNTMLAAAKLGLPAFGWDLEEKYRNAFIHRVTSESYGSWKSY